MTLFVCVKIVDPIQDMLAPAAVSSVTEQRKDTENHCQYDDDNTPGRRAVFQECKQKQHAYGKHQKTILHIPLHAHQYNVLFLNLQFDLLTFLICYFSHVITSPD